MESHRDVWFAALCEIGYKQCNFGNLPVRRGAGRHWNDEGALRMMFGMRVRGALLAALIMFAVPVAGRAGVCAGCGPDRGVDRR